MKKSFTSDTTAAAELFTTPTITKTQTNNATAGTTEQGTVKKIDRLTPPAPPAKPADTIDTESALSWKARPDGETRSRRLQITCKPSIATKAAKLARANGISLNYLFELLILDAWKEATGDSDK